MSYCRYLNRQTQLKPGANKRMENVFRPFICGDPHRDRALPQDLGASLAIARGACRQRCPAKFGLAPAGKDDPGKE